MNIWDRQDRILNPECLAQQLTSAESRADSLLVFGGTGVNLWVYYPFLRQFSLDQLSEFRGIYGISGGASCVWYYVLEQMGLFDSASIANYESALRTLNRGSVFSRLWGLIRNTYIYQTRYLADGIEQLACPTARRLKFSEFALKNFYAVAYDFINNSLLLLNNSTSPMLQMGDAMASLAAPERIGGRRFGKPLSFDGFGITDIDFANSDIRNEFKHILKAQQAKVFWLNVAFSSTKNEFTYVKVPTNRWPRVTQLTDLLMFFGNIPNKRIGVRTRNT